MNRRGFALVAVLWLLAMVSASVAIGLDAARLSVTAARNRLGLAKAEWARESCVAIAQARYEKWVQASDAIDQNQLDTAVTKLFRIDSVDLGDGTWCSQAYTDGGAVVRLQDVDSGGICPKVVATTQWRLNLNSAPPALLACLPGLDREAVRVVVGARRARPFHSIDDVLTVLSGEQRRGIMRQYGTFSRMVALHPPLVLLEAVGHAGWPSLESGLTVAARVGGRQLEIVWREAR
jgi:type II secretory pathway component PulK